MLYHTIRKAWVSDSRAIMASCFNVMSDTLWIRFSIHQPFLTLSQTIPDFCVSAVKDFWKHCGKMRNLLVTSNFFFSHSVFYLFGEFKSFSSSSKYSSAIYFSLEEFKICLLGKSWGCSFVLFSRFSKCRNISKKNHLIGKSIWFSHKLAKLYSHSEVFNHYNVQIHKTWRQRETMILRMVSEYGPSNWELLKKKCCLRSLLSMSNFTFFLNRFHIYLCITSDFGGPAWLSGKVFDS